MSNIGKTLKDYNPTPSTLQGGQTFQSDKAPLPNNYESGPFDASRSTSSDGGGTEGTITPAEKFPLKITASKPPYIPDSVSSPFPSQKRYYIELGSLNEKLANNWDGYYDISTTTWFFAKATLRTSNTLLVQNWEIVTGSSIDAYTTSNWMIGQDRPSTAFHVLGAVFVTDGSHYVTNMGRGSLMLLEQLTNIDEGPAGAVNLGKQIYFIRNF